MRALTSRRDERLRSTLQREELDLALELDDGTRRVVVGGRWAVGRGWAGPARRPHRLHVNPQQLDVLLHGGGERVVMACGGKGAGKTTLGVDWLLLRAVERAGERFWSTAPIYKTTRVSWRKFLERCPRAWIKRVAQNNHELSIELKNGSTIEFRSTREAQNLEGDDPHDILVDEPGDVSREAWEALRQRVDSRRGNRRLLATGTPKDEIADILDELERSPAPGVPPLGRIFYLDARQNRFGAGAEKLAELAHHYDEREYERVVGGRLTRRPGACYYPFDAGAGGHVRPVPQLGATDITAHQVALSLPRLSAPGDVVTAWTLAPDSGRALACRVLRAYRLADGSIAWWAAREFTSRATTVRELARQVAAAPGLRRAIAVIDSRPSEIRDANPYAALVSEGFRVFGAAAAQKPPPVQASVDAVNALLKPAAGPPRLFVDPSCEDLRASLRGVMWGPGGTIDLRSLPPGASGADDLRFFAWRFARPRLERAEAAHDAAHGV